MAGLVVRQMDSEEAAAPEDFQMDSVAGFAAGLVAHLEVLQMDSEEDSVAGCSVVHCFRSFRMDQQHSGSGLAEVRQTSLTVGNRPEVAYSAPFLSRSGAAAGFLPGS